VVGQQASEDHNVPGHERERTASEIAAQNAINAAAAAAATGYFEALAKLPRWRRWLIQRLTPRYPMVSAEIPPGPTYITRPLMVAPGVLLSGVRAVPAGVGPGYPAGSSR